MNAEGPAVETALIEQEIAARIGAAKLRLRFDKAVLRLVGRLKTTLAKAVPAHEAIVFTVSAPIRLPAKTAAALEGVVSSGLPGGAFRSIVHGNQVQIRRIKGVAASMPRVLGFVHHPGSDAGLILDLAVARLFQQP